MSVTSTPLSYQSLKHQLTPRLPDSYKGTNGHVLLIGGDSGYGGAIAMAAEACARTGAGLTSVFTQAENIPVILTRRPEVMPHAANNSSIFNKLLKNASAIVLGPGLGQSDWSVELFETTMTWLQNNNTPAVLDADALNLLSQHAKFQRQPLPANCLITPHIGEAARLLGTTSAEILEDRNNSAIKLFNTYHAISILKGPGTLIASGEPAHPDRIRLDQCTHGNPGMGSGGMGDVLSGVLGALLAQGFSPLQSARLGVCIHSLAADLAAQANGERGLLATDLFPYLRKLMNPALSFAVDSTLD